MIIRIKICGITRLADARVAVNLGVDALGFIFYPKSPRYIRPSAAAAIISKLPPLIAKVGVFVDETEKNIRSIIDTTGIDTLQLHGNEPPRFCANFNLPVIKAFSIGPGADLSILRQYKVSAFLLDTWHPDHRGGTGRVFDWSIAKEAAVQYPIILAGGLGPVNVQEAIEMVCPYGVDINSGVEIKPGVKNPHKMREVLGIVRGFK